MSHSHKKKQYRLWINELRLKESISTTLTHFYNPVAIIVLVIVARNSISDEFVVVPKAFNSSSKYITFIEKNNERILKKISIDYLFQELPQNNFEIFFFLVEINNQIIYSEVLIKLEKSLNTSLSSVAITSEFITKSMQDFFENLPFPNIFLLKETILALNGGLEIHISNNLLSLNASLKIHF
jgi:hypothetical protein